MKDEMITHAKAIGDNVQQELKGRVGRSGQRQNRVSRERKKQAKEKRIERKATPKDRKIIRKIIRSNSLWTTIQTVLSSIFCFLY